MRLTVLALAVLTTTATAAPLFRKPVTVDSGVLMVAATQMVAADFNKDGFPDLAISNGGRLSILINDGSGPFAAPLVTSQSILGMDAADFDGDGDQDLVTTYGGTLRLLLGNGDGTFTASATSWPATLGRVLAADVNGDGKPDAVSFTSDTFISPPELSVHLGDGQGGFAPAAKTSVPSPTFNVVAADLNLDGRSDFLVETTGGIRVYVTSAGGTLQSVFVGGRSTHVVVGRFNADNIPDFGIVDPIFSELLIYIGNGNGTFTVGSSYPLAYETRVAVRGDVDGDGMDDIVASGNVVAVLRGLGTGAFEPARLTSAGLRAARLAVRDFDRDGKNDLVTLPDAVPFFLKGSGDGTFRNDRAFFARSPLPSTGAVFGEAVADLNADGRPDAVTITLDRGSNARTLSVLLNDGSGGLLPPSHTPLAADAQRLVVGRVNGDAPPDAVVFTTASASVFFGNGSGGWTTGPSTTLTTAVGVFAKTRLADFTGDSIADLMIDSSLYEGNGDGTFDAPRSTGATLDLTGDLDRNGTLDLIWRDTPMQRLAVALGGGGGSFGAPAFFGTGGERLLTLGDFDGDGVLDVVTTSEDGLRTYSGSGDGTFRDPVLFTWTHLSLSDAHAADFDGDGNLDLAFDTTVFLGNGDGRFREVHTDDGFGASEVADFDGDGKPDLILFGSAITIVRTGLAAEPQRDSSITFSSDTAQGEYAKPILFSSTVSGNGTPMETGSVVYWSGDQPIGAGKLELGVPSASASLSRALPVGTHALRAVYSGDEIYRPSTATLSQSVDRATTTMHAPAELSGTYGFELFSFVALGAPTVRYLPGPVRVYTLQVDGAPHSDVTWTEDFSQTTAKIRGLTAGSHTLVFSYSGDANYKPSSATTTATIVKRTLNILASVSPEGRKPAGPITFNAKFSGGSVYGTTTGTFTFTIAGKPPITVPIEGETTSATMMLTAGTYDLTVEYSGDANNLPATSSSRFVVVGNHRRSVRH